MGTTEELADALARDTLAAMDELGDDRFYMEVSKVLGATSPTTQEAFMTAVRVRLAERRARDFLDARLRAAREGGAPPPAASAPDAGH
jgi:hypothetical protein